MGVEHPTGTDTTAETTDQPKPSGKPPAPPPDKPGSPGQPSRMESLARARQPLRQENGTQQDEAKDSGAQPAGAVASTQADSDEKRTDDARNPEAEDKPSSGGDSPGSGEATTSDERDEETETDDRSASAERRYTLPADNPGSPTQPSRLESLARAREPVRQESGPQQTDATDTGSRPPEENEDTPGSPNPESDGPKAEDVGEPPADEVRPEPTGTERQDAPKPANAIPDDLDRRIPGDGPPDDNGGAADFDEDALERGISDRLKQIAAKLDPSDRRKELAETVDRPDFQDPKEDPKNIPDRYGTPLDRTDGSRTPLFNGRPKREQAEQGALGDCGVIATLGAVAEHYPEAIRDCVRETDDGNYQVRLHEAKYSTSKQRYEATGRPITLTVTPDLPVDDQRPGKPAFARDASSGAAWAPVLEKAIAGTDQTWPARRRSLATELWNVRGNTGDAPSGYVRLNQGSNPAERAELLTQLTGRPAKTVQFPTGYDNQGRNADRRLHDEIVDQLSQNKPVIVGTRTPLKGEPPLPRKLVKGHAYEVIKVDDQGRIHLRNPWNDRHPEPLTIQEFKAGIRPRYSTLE